MKKFAAFILTATMLMAFASCSSGDDTANTNAQGVAGAQATEANLGGDGSPAGLSEAPSGSSKYVYKVNGKSFTAGNKIEDAIAALGDDYKYDEQPSCAFQGLDKTYMYTSIIIRNVVVDDVDYISSIELRDDSVVTPEGIYVGCTEEEVRSVYGEPTEEKSSGIEYTDGSCTLSFIIKDGSVAAISYNLASK